MQKLRFLIALAIFSSTSHATEFNQECTSSPVSYSTTPRAFTVSGIISNSAKLPVSGAQINFYKPSGEFENYATTDELGVYSLDIQAGAYVVEVVNRSSGSSLFLNAPRDAASRQIIKGKTKLNATIDSNKPVITEAKAATLGTKAGYIIKGSDFGTTRGYVDLNGYLTNSTSYIKSWTPTQINLVKATTMPTTGCLKVYAKTSGYSDCFDY